MVSPPRTSPSGIGRIEPQDRDFFIICSSDAKVNELPRLSVIGNMNFGSSFVFLKMNRQTDYSAAPWMIHDTDGQIAKMQTKPHIATQVHFGRRVPIGHDADIELMR